jgi:hypothetical protein
MGGQRVVVNKPRVRHQGKELVSHLQDDHPDPAASLREGLDETLTLKDMNLSESLERTSPPLR